MSLFNWVLAGTVVALAATLPQSSEARFGPVGPVSQSGSLAVQKTGDDYLAPWQRPGAGRVYGGGIHRGGYYGGARYYNAGHRYHRHYGRGYGYRGYRGSNFSFSLGVGAPLWGYGPGWGGYHYAPPPVVVYRPSPRVYHRSGGYEPWTPSWYSYCSSRYRTFNPRTGYYFYKVGRQRFCR